MARGQIANLVPNKFSEESGRPDMEATFNRLMISRCIVLCETAGMGAT
jgi:hypothetical protein